MGKVVLAPVVAAAKNRAACSKALPATVHFMSHLTPPSVLSILHGLALRATFSPSQDKLLEKAFAEKQAFVVSLAQPSWAVRLQVYVALIVVLVKDSEKAAPIDLVHAGWRVIERLASDFHATFGVNVVKPMPIIAGMLKVIKPVIERMGWVKLDANCGQSVKDNVPSLRTSYVVCPMAVVEGEFQAFAFSEFNVGREKFTRSQRLFFDGLSFVVAPADHNDLCPKERSQLNVSAQFVKAPFSFAFVGADKVPSPKPHCVDLDPVALEPFLVSFFASLPFGEVVVDVDFNAREAILFSELQVLLRPVRDEPNSHCFHLLKPILSAPTTGFYPNAE
jgi:hypothetical protein